MCLVTNTCTNYLFECSHSRTSWFLSLFPPSGAGAWGITPGPLLLPLPYLSAVAGGQCCTQEQSLGARATQAGGPFVPMHLGVPECARAQDVAVTRMGGRGMDTRAGWRQRRPVEERGRKKKRDGQDRLLSSPSLAHGGKNQVG